RLEVPGVGHDDADLTTLEEGRYRLRTLEIDVHQAAEQVLAPVLAIKQQQVPAALGHQGQVLPVSLSIQHPYGHPLKETPIPGTTRSATLCPTRVPGRASIQRPRRPRTGFRSRCCCYKE